jgi:hypothetical protein
LLCRFGGRGCTRPHASAEQECVDRFLSNMTWNCPDDAGNSSDPSDAGKMLPPFRDVQCYPFLGPDGNPVKAWEYNAFIHWLQSPDFPKRPPPFLIFDQCPHHTGQTNQKTERGDTLAAPDDLPAMIKCA